MNKMTLRTLPALMLIAFSGTASAAAFQLWEQNASGLGTAYAGSAAVADNASTVFFNPAGMTQLKGFQLSAGVNGIGPRFEFNNEGSSGLLGGSGNGGNARQLGSCAECLSLMATGAKLVARLWHFGTFRLVDRVQGQQLDR